MKEGDKVKLLCFNGLTQKPIGIIDSENYWKLIKCKGVVLQDPTEKNIYASFSKLKRVLVKFDLDLKSLNLTSHNSIENSLWILESDLMICEE